MSRPERPPFPVDKTGDVRITITPERKYQLSSDRLKEAGSSALTLKLDEKHAATLCGEARGSSVTTRFHFMLGFQPGSTQPYLFALLLTDWGMPCPADEHGRLLAFDANLNTFTPIVPFDPKRDPGTRSNAFVEAWHIVLALITGNSFQLPDLRAAFPREAYGVFLATAVNMVEIATSLGCHDKAVKRVQEELFIDLPLLSAQVSHDPAFWLYLANHIRSDWLWKEAIIHAVGFYNSTNMQIAIEKGRLKSFDASLIANKAQKLKDEVQRTLSFIMNELGDTERHTHTHTLGGKNIEVAIQVFRGYLHDSFEQGGAGNPWEWADFGFSAVKQFSNKKYLSDAEIVQRVEQEGYTQEPYKSDIITIVKNLKQSASSQVKHLIKNESRVSIKEKHKLHFTCTVIDNADVPFKAFK